MKEEKLLFGRFLDTFIDFGLFRYKSLPRIIRNVERNLIVWELSRCNGNQRKAAKMLKMKYSTLNAKVQKYDVRFDVSVW